MSDLVATLLQAQKFVEDGWCQGGLGLSVEGYGLGLCDLDRACSVCLAGAIHKATEDFKLISEAYDALGFRNAVDTGRWNDEYGRTKEQVIERIDIALVRLGVMDDV